MGKILLFYKYIEIEYPKQIQKWQLKLCETLELKGRIIIAHEGINGTIGGNKDNINLYIKEMLAHPLFNNIDFKQSLGEANFFPKLRVVIKNEIVRLGLDTKLFNSHNAGKHISPEIAHKLLEEKFTQQKHDDLIIFDIRNKYESNIGQFKNSIKANINNFRELPAYINSNIEVFKNKKVLMYCTGGIRCERASAYLKQKNITKEIYQLEGGIHNYTEKYPDGFFRGQNYVFDGRISTKINDDIIGNCYICNTIYNEYTNCLNAQCNRHFICCNNCIVQLNNSCSIICQNLIKENKVNLRPYFKKMEIPNYGN